MVLIPRIPVIGGKIVIKVYCIDTEMFFDDTDNLFFTVISVSCRFSVDPGIPDINVVFFQVAHICVTTQEP